MFFYFAGPTIQEQQSKNKTNIPIPLSVKVTFNVGCHVQIMQCEFVAT